MGMTYDLAEATLYVRKNKNKFLKYSFRHNTENLSIGLNSFWSSEIFIQSSTKESISFIDDKLEKLSEILDS